MGRRPAGLGGCATLLGVWLLAGCGTGAAFDAARPVPAPALLPGAAALLGLQQIGDAAAALERAFDDPIPVKLKPGAAPASAAPAHCKALLELQTRISGTAQPTDWTVLQQRLADCQALRWLAGVSPARFSALPVDWRSALDTTQWPAALWPAISADEVAVLARPGQTLRTVSRRVEWQWLESAAPPAMRLQGEGYTVQVQWLAQGDFDGDGAQDWLLRWQARVAEGSWREARCLLVSRQAEHGSLRVVRPE